jgi:serine/threonine kinase 32
MDGQIVALLMRGCQLLERNPKKRLGCRTGFPTIDEIRSHGWFSQINWEKLEAKQLDPPFVPNVSPSSPFSHVTVTDPQVQQNSSNFDVSHELDEFILAEKPLAAHKRKANPEKMKPEMRQLESDFAVYDFERTGRRSYYPLTGNEPPVAQHSHDDHLRPMFSSSSHTNTYVQSSLGTTHSRSSTSPSEPPRYSSQHDSR